MEVEPSAVTEAAAAAAVDGAEVGVAAVDAMVWAVVVGAATWARTHPLCSVKLSALEVCLRARTVGSSSQQKIQRAKAQPLAGGRLWESRTK